MGVSLCLASLLEILASTRDRALFNDSNSCISSSMDAGKKGVADLLTSLQEVVVISFTDITHLPICLVLL